MAVIGDTQGSSQLAHKRITGNLLGQFFFNQIQQAPLTVIHAVASHILPTQYIFKPWQY